jgi:hypothetical protein
MVTESAIEQFEKNDVELSVPKGEPRPILIIVMVSWIGAVQCNRNPEQHAVKVVESTLGGRRGRGHAGKIFTGPRRDMLLAIIYLLGQHHSSEPIRAVTSVSVTAFASMGFTCEQRELR